MTKELDDINVEIQKLQKQRAEVLSEQNKERIEWLKSLCWINDESYNYSSYDLSYYWSHKLTCGGNSIKTKFRYGGYDNICLYPNNNIKSVQDGIFIFQGRNGLGIELVTYNKDILLNFIDKYNIKISHDNNITEKAILYNTLFKHMVK